MNRALVTAAVAFAFIGCEPCGPFAGSALEGPVESVPSSDWRFSEAFDVIQLETRPTNPYSVNLWCVTNGTGLYIGSGRGEDSKWSHHIADDPRVRVRVGKVIYELQAVRVRDPDEVSRALELYRKKYEYTPPSDAPNEGVLFRLDPRS